MFIELTNLCNQKEYINVDSIQRVESSSLGITLYTQSYINSYKESYEEVKAMIQQYTEPKFIIGGMTDDED